MLPPAHPYVKLVREFYANIKGKEDESEEEEDDPLHFVTHLCGVTIEALGK